MALETLKRQLRPIYVPIFERSATARVLALLAQPRHNRNTEFVNEGYGDRWEQYLARLDRCSTLDEWLWIPGYDDVKTTSIVRGRMHHGNDWNAQHFYVSTIEETIRSKFPKARSITEYGCGIGRPLLALKRRMPHLECFGYELTPEGMSVGQAAAKKFGLDVKFGQLDYIKDPHEKYVHPKTDLALTVFSLEQIPHVAPVAVKNMLDHVNIGSIHVEPVAENYPHNYIGLLGRLYTKRVDYLQNFDSAVRALPVHEVSVRTLDSSHNPLIPTPSLYTLVK
jgi:hypothetical protein